MRCPLCNTEAVITKQRMVFKASETKLYRNLVYSCRNKNCNSFEKEIGEVANEEPVETE